ncbi:MAG TPA: hypothetical protein VJC01_02095 [Candidatus Paceibacterota bacterium]
MAIVREKTQIITLGGQPYAIILDIKKYERLLEAAEEKTDLAELHRIKKDKTSFRELKEYLKRVQSFN